MREHGTHPRRRAAAIAALVLSAAAAAPGRTAAAEADAEAYRRILAERSPAVVTIRFVLDIQLGGRKHVTREEIAHGLRPLLDLPVELVLPAHGEPLDRAALERVLS